MPAGATARSPRFADDARAAGLRRPPVPPPLAPPVPPSVAPPAAVGPRTTAAPFQAVPTPSADLPPAAPGLHDVVPEFHRPVTDDRGSDLHRSVREAPRAVRPPASSPPPMSESLMAARSDQPWGDDDHDAPWMTGRGVLRAPRQANRPAGAPFVERRGSRLPTAGPVAAGAAAPAAESPAYGDWTKPSAPPADRLPAAPVGMAPLVIRSPAPLTTAIPDRDVAGRRGDVGGLGGYDDAYDGDDYEDEAVHGATRSAGDIDDDYDDAYDDEDLDAGYVDEANIVDDRYADRIDDTGTAAALGGGQERGPSHPGTGPVGGRAASRARRQATEAARVEAAKRSGRPSAAMLDEQEQTGRRPRRFLQSLVTVAVIALGMLGVYQFTSPGPQETSARTPVASSASPSSTAAQSTALPPLVTEVPAVATAAATPVRVPVTVLNATDIPGLAAKAEGVIEAGKWQSAGIGSLRGADIAANTVYFTEGDDEQRQAALQLIDAFPQLGLSGPAVRFFEVPADVPTSTGVVVVLTEDWQP